MKSSTMRACFSLVILLSTVASAFAQTQPPPAQPSPAARPVGTTGERVAPATSTAADYRLVNGDKLRIEVYKDAQLSQSVQVRPDGKITLPLVGDVVASGRTSGELRDAIATSLKEYIANPVVTVIVVETVPPTIYVMGEVYAPGPQPLKGQVSILQALAAAGGFKDFANTKDIQILRQTRTGTSRLSFNYKDAVKGEGKILYLEPGDTVIVK